MRRPTPVVSIIIVSYNTKTMTLECLRSVSAETDAAYELIVVDNASSDGSAEAIAKEFPNITFMAEAENHGFAKANNIAAKHARGEYILLLNPDTLVLDSAVDKLLAFARAKPAAKIWGGRTVYRDGTLNNTCCYQRMTLWNIFCRAVGLTALSKNHRFFSEVYGSWDMNDVRSVDIVTGCFLLIRRGLWEDLGGFDIDYFMYGEEADLCLRATKKFAANPHFTPNAQIVHYGRASENVEADRLVRLYKAKITLIHDHLPRCEQPLGRWLFRLIPLGRRVIFASAAAVTRRPAHRKSAMVWREIWARRTEWQDGQSKPDEEAEA